MRAITSIALAVAARLAATANQAAIDISAYHGDYEGRLVLNASATEAADNTFDCKLQHSDDNVTFIDAGIAFAQVTNAAASHQVLTVKPCDLKKYVRVVDTLGGTTPKVTRTVELVAKQTRV